MSVAVSVVVPCRDDVRTLAACLDALALQDAPARTFEVVVVDGSATEACRELAREKGARILRDPGLGPGAARNIGIQGALGAIVAFTDADCMPRPDWLTRVCEAFAEDPGLAGVAGAIRMPRATFLGRLEDDEARAFYRGMITSNVAYRRDALLAVGGFDESLSCAEDYDLAWRLMDAGYRVVHDPRPVVVHAPPEVEQGLRRYLRKQFWYARSDVPAHARALRRYRARRDARGSASALVGGLAGARDAGFAALALAGLASRRPLVAVAGIGGALASATTRVLRAGRDGRVPLGEMASRVGVVAARQLVRGAGTLSGLLALARAPLTTREARVPLAPPPVPVPQAARRARAPD